MKKSKIILFFVTFLFVVEFWSGFYCYAETSTNPSPFKISGVELTDGHRHTTLEPLDWWYNWDVTCRLDTGAVDIVFVIDNTGSMGGQIAGVRSNISSFASEMNARGYDYRLGGVCYGDAVGPNWDPCSWAPGYRELYDANPGAAGWQMTSDYWGSFRGWINSIPAWGGCDSPENALCALEAAMNNYDWRPGALHILIFFTDACYYQTGDYGCDGYCSYYDDQVYNDIISRGFVLFTSTNTSPYCASCASIGSSGSYNWYRNTSLASSGNWYTLGTSWSTIFADVVVMLSEFNMITITVTNTSGATLNPVNGQLMPRSCITISGGLNPQSGGPVYNGGSITFWWRVNVAEPCPSPSDCFQIRIWSGGYDDTIGGCWSIGEDCACLITVDAGPDRLICYPGSVTIGGSPTASDGVLPYSYVWTPATGLSNPYVANPVASPTTTTTYTVTVTDGISCIGSDEVTVTVSNPHANAGPDHSICLGGSVTIGGSPTGWGGFSPLTFYWSPATGLSNRTSPNPTASPTTSTQYTITVTDGVGCTATDAVWVYIYDPPAVDAGRDVTICTGYSATIGGSPTATGGSPPYSYLWTPGTTLSSTTVSNPVATPDTSTSYTITVTDSRGCTNSDVIRVTLSDPPEVDAGPDIVICQGDTGTIGGTPAANGGFPPYTFTWTPSAGLSNPNASNPLAFPDITETYIITVVDNLGCIGVDTVTVTVALHPDIDAGEDVTICVGETIALGGRPTATGGTPPYSYSWEPISTLSDPNAANPVASPETTTTYILTVSDYYGCTSVDSIVVTVSEPHVHAGNDTIMCAGDPIVLGATPPYSGGIGRFNFNWTSEPPGFISAASNPVAYPETTTTYIIEGIDEAGCHAYDTVLVTVSQIWADAGIDTTICISESWVLGGSPAAGGGIGRYTYYWSSDPRGFSSYASNPLVNPEITTTYFLEATDEIGCIAYDTVIITVSNSPIAQVVYPAPCGGVTSCEDQGFIALVLDRYYEIDEFSLRATVNYRPLDIRSPELSWHPPDSVIYHPRSPWSHGDIVHFSLDSAANIFGCVANLVSCSVIVDLEPPVPFDPVPAMGETVFVPNPDITLEITDDIAGVDPMSFIPDNITITVNGEEVSGFTPTWDGSQLRIQGLSFVNNDTVMICLDSLYDAPDYDYCAPNDTSYCWWFYVRITEPVAWLIEPIDINGDGRVISACLCQPVIIGIFDEDGIDTMTIELIVEGISYTFPNPRLTFTGDRLFFSPAMPCWEDSQVVEFLLVSADDNRGYPLSDTVYGEFLVDLSPPAYSGEYPPDGSASRDLTTNIYVSLIDTVSGYTNIDSVQLRVIVNGTDTTWHDSLYIEDFSLSMGDRVEVCAFNAHDNPDYCAPNTSTFCWEFEVTIECSIYVALTASDTMVCAEDSVTLRPLIISGYPPFEYHWQPPDFLTDSLVRNPTAFNPTDSIWIWFHVTVIDSYGCIAEDSLLIAFSQIVADAGPEYEVCPDDTVFLGGIPAADRGIPPYQFHWTNNMDTTWSSDEEHPGVSPDTTTIYYLEATDSIGCVAYDTVTIINDFIPVGDFGFVAPDSGALLPPGDIELIWEEAPGTPPVYYILYMDDTVVAALIESTHYTVNYPCGHHHSWYVEAINICGFESFRDMLDSLCPGWLGCAHLSDPYSPDWPPNFWAILDSCCSLPGFIPGIFDTGFDPSFSTYPCDGPVGTIIRPLPNTYSACDPESIIVAIEDTDGVVESTIQLIVDGVTFTTDSSALRWEEPILIYKPLTSWENGDTVCVSLIAADDSYGNPLSAPLNWCFIIDYAPPVVWHVSPPCGSTIYTDVFSVEFYVHDSLSGLAPGNLLIIVEDSDTYNIFGPCMTWDGDSVVTFDPICAGYSFSGGDVFTYCIHSEDTPDYCAPNVHDTCCTYIISMECSLQASAGPDQTICPGSDVELGCSPTAWSGVPPYTYIWSPATGLSSTTSPNPIASPSITTEYVLEVRDSMDCVIIDTVTVYVIHDPPGPFGLLFPPPGAMLPPGDVTFEWEEAPGTPPIFYDLYIDGSLVESFMDSTHYTIFYPCGHTHTWEVMAYNICYDYFVDCYFGIFDTTGEMTDSTLYGPFSDTLPSDPPFSTYPCEGPIATIIRPLPNTFSACLPESIIIHLVGTDTFIVESTIVLSVNSELYCTSDPELRYEGDSFLIFNPDPPWLDGEVVDVALLEAVDYNGVPLADTLSWSFTLDYSPPVVCDIIPPPGAHVPDVPPEISLLVFDWLSGLDDRDSVLYLIINSSDTFSISSSYITWDGDSILTFDPISAGYTMSYGDTLFLCLHTQDTPDYCEPNESTYCWFVVRLECDLTLDIGVNAYVCGYDSVQLDPVVAGGTPPYSYRWTPANCVCDACCPNTYAFVPPGEIRNYVTFHLLVTDSLGCFLEDSLLVTFSLITADAGPEVEICPHDTVQLGGNPVAVNGIPPYRYSWANDIDPLWVSDEEHPLVSPDWTTVYFLETVDSIDCYAYDTVVITNEFIPVGDFEAIAPTGNPSLQPGPITIEWEEAPGTQPVVYTLYIDDTIVAPLIDSTHYTIIYPCGHAHSWNVHALNVCGVADFEEWADNFCYSRLYNCVENFHGDPEIDIFEIIDSCCSEHTPVYSGIMLFDLNPSFTTYPCEGPVATIIRPDSNTYTACEPDTIILLLEDTSVIVETTIELEVQDVVYTIDDHQLTWLEPYIFFIPDPQWENAEIVHVRLLEAKNRLGASLQHRPIEWWFTVDLTPPVAELLEPLPGDRIRNPQPEIIIHITDSLSGLDIYSIELTINGIAYSNSDFLWDEYAEIITIFPQNPVSPGDTIDISISACDMPDYCNPNCDTTYWIIPTEPVTSCLVHPNPFTPNDDDINDYIVFDYPDMFNEKAMISIYNIRNVKVWNREMPPVTDFNDFLERSWNGLDNKNRRLPEGIYIYTVEVDRKVVCNGTIILAR
ncbi:gliding motility-associated C-terminal domain-containing protein [bacterium]|nr:gliding motility-associated C-terminal domain-containing protein [bacterium]